MAEEASLAKAPAVAWWLARSAGASPEQAQALAQWGERALLAAAIGLHLGLATCEDLAEAARLVDPLSYLLSREDGFNHDESILAAGSDLNAVGALVQRFGRATALEALKAGVAPADYAAYRRFVGHDQALEAHRSGVRAADYVLAASSGASHAEVLDAVAKGVDLWGYARKRNLGLDHDKAVAAPLR